MKRFAIICATLLSLGAVAPAIAAPTYDKGLRSMPLVQIERPNVVRLAQSNREISASEAKRIALSRVRGGEVVDIRRTGDAYRVRVIARDGRVIDIVVDARTGRVR
ncbi:MAG: PepSY domain-containing protein [Pseudomonadota bacterium]